MDQFENEALGEGSHAEGKKTMAAGIASHSEGLRTEAKNPASHSEGLSTIASGDAAHAEGIDSKAMGGASHSEGLSSEAQGDASHAEGNQNYAVARASHAEGQFSFAVGLASHTEGQSTIAKGTASHAEGQNTESNGEASHAEGMQTSAYGEPSHAEGWRTTATGFASHAEGQASIAGGDATHAEGYETNANGLASHTEGYRTTTGARYAHAEGECTTAILPGAHIMGRFGEADEAYSWHLANGVDEQNPNLSVKITGASGNIYTIGMFSSRSSAYAEMFETQNGQIIEPGYFIALDGERIYKATGLDSYILGVSCAVSAICGSDAQLSWSKKLETDEWGQIQAAFNPEWIKDRHYEPRSKRPEWTMVALLGSVLVRDDGSCLPNGYCMSNSDGVATTAETGFRVLKRVSENKILILMR